MLSDTTGETTDSEATHGQGDLVAAARSLTAPRPTAPAYTPLYGAIYRAVVRRYHAGSHYVKARDVQQFLADDDDPHGAGRYAALAGFDELPSRKTIGTVLAVFGRAGLLERWTHPESSRAIVWRIPEAFPIRGAAALEATRGTHPAPDGDA